MCGTAILYAARTIMPVCIVEVADAMKWDKTESVSRDYCVWQLDIGQPVLKFCYCYQCLQWYLDISIIINLGQPVFWTTVTVRNSIWTACFELLLLLAI